MSPEHDPLLQAHYLRQCLSHDKRPIGLLLGAGCPMAIRVSRDGSDEPLIPDIAGVTAIAFSEMRKSGVGKAFEVAYSHFKRFSHSRFSHLRKSNRCHTSNVGNQWFIRTIPTDSDGHRTARAQKKTNWPLIMGEALSQIMSLE